MPFRYQLSMNINSNHLPSSIWSVAQFMKISLGLCELILSHKITKSLYSSSLDDGKLFDGSKKLRHYRFVQSNMKNFVSSSRELQRSTFLRLLLSTARRKLRKMFAIFPLSVACALLCVESSSIRGALSSRISPMRLC